MGLCSCSRVALLGLTNRCIACEPSVFIVHTDPRSSGGVARLAKGTCCWVSGETAAAEQSTHPGNLMLLSCLAVALHSIALQQLLQCTSRCSRVHVCSSPVQVHLWHCTLLQKLCMAALKVHNKGRHWWLMLSSAVCICTKSHQKSWLYENKIWTPDRNADKCLPEGKVEVGGNNKIRNWSECDILFKGKFIAVEIGLEFRFIEPLTHTVCLSVTPPAFFQWITYNHVTQWVQR